MKKFLAIAVLNLILFLGAVILSSQAQSASVTIQCNDTNNPQINSKSTNSLSLQSGNATCTATAYTGIASGYWQYSYNGGPFQYLAGAQVTVSGSGIPYGTYQVRGIGTDANGNPIAPSNVVTINYSAAGSGGGGSGGGGGGGGTVQVPGPSQALFASPYYQCKANYYVSNSGSDSNNGSSGAPWATLRRADSMNVGAGSCINVAPGTYDGLTVTHGGNAATSTGYVVYRCQTMDQCIITGNAGDNGTASVQTDDSNVTSGKPNTVNYVQFDGFEMAGTSPEAGQNFGVGFSIVGDNGGTAVASHHVWLLNSIVHGFSQSGVQMNESDYHYAIHNTIYNNANSNRSNCGAQGSGWSAWEEHPVPGYAPTADDQNNPVFGSWQVASSFFHVVVEYNVVYNNSITQGTCGTTSSPNDTDGNGIIFDTNAQVDGNPTNYTYPMLAAYNIVYNNGGGGIHVFGSSNVTVANNSCYNNYLDPDNGGTFRGCIDDTGFNNTYLNNIAVAVPTVTTNCNVSPPYTKFNSAMLLGPERAPYSTWLNNLTDMIGVGCNSEVNVGNTGDTYNVPPNIERTSPGWVNVGTSSVGTETTPPVGTNFALSPGSPAIGKGLTEPYLPPSSVDLGACASSLATCP